MLMAAGGHLAREVGKRLDDPALRKAQVEAQSAALLKMGRGGPDPSEAAADAACPACASAPASGAMAVMVPRANEEKQA